MTRTFTVLDDTTWTIRNKLVNEIDTNDLSCMLVEYSVLYDNSISIDRCTSKEPFVHIDDYGFHKDVIVDNESYARYLAIMDY